MRKALLAAALSAFAFVACLQLGNDRMMTVGARFDDIGDLAPGAPVMMADVQVGKVEEIDLDEGQAELTMSIDPAAQVPQGVVARIRRTSLLGERIVDLYVPPELPLDAPLLQDGTRIEETQTRPDLEDLVDEGNYVLAPIAASEVATLVDEGAKGFGSQGQELRTLLFNFRDIVHAYKGRTGQIRGFITALDRFNSILATRARAHAQAVANSARSFEVLREEIDELDAAIRALDRLAVGGRGILEAHSDEMGRFFGQMRAILEVLNDNQEDIVKILKWAPGHNRNLQTTEYLEFVQVYQDFIFCGLNDDPSDAARRCPPEDHP
jgi:phospholipid/cholesterol/gamma-HCH transport system substrate-binding protein